MEVYFLLTMETLIFPFWTMKYSHWSHYLYPIYGTPPVEMLERNSPRAQALVYKCCGMEELLKALRRGEKRSARFDVQSSRLGTSHGGCANGPLEGEYISRGFQLVMGWWDASNKNIWLVVTGCHQFGILPEILGVANHPNWRSYFSEGWPNHQPENIWSFFMGLIDDG